MRVGWRILRRALASIWRMRSRVTLELPADFLERARIAVAQAEAQFQDFLLPVGSGS